MRTSNMYSKNVDKGDLTQTIIIITGFAVAVVLVIGALASVLMDKGETAAQCIGSKDFFKVNGENLNDCKNRMEDVSENVNNNYFYKPTAALESDLVLRNFNENEVIIDEDLQRFANKMEDFKEKHGAYPTNEELVLLEYQVTTSAYPEEYAWNFEYCVSPRHNEYVLAVNTYDNAIMYVSNHNQVSGKYVVEGDPHKDTGGNGYPSPCFSGPHYSAADRIGLRRIAVADAEENKIISGSKASAGKQGATWSDWTMGGTANN